MTVHRIVNPPELSPATGFAHAVVAAPGRTVYLGGQTAQRPDGSIEGTTLVEQFGVALRNLAATLTACGATSEDLVHMVVYTTDAGQYRHNLRALGAEYRKYLGKHYPAMALFEVAGLFDPDALVELVGTAVIPQDRESLA